MKLEIPDHIVWPVHRVATSGRYQDSLHTIWTRWSLADVMDANAILDAFDDAAEE